MIFTRESSFSSIEFTSTENVELEFQPNERGKIIHEIKLKIKVRHYLRKWGKLWEQIVITGVS